MTTDRSSEPLVVVGVDGSPESVAALKRAADYAAATGATISAVLAWHYPAAAGPVSIGVAPTSISDGVRLRMQEALDEALTEVFGTSTPDKVRTTIAYGHPAQVLADESQRADLLVVGHRGQRDDVSARC